MLESRLNGPVARIRERSFWVPVIEQALRHYGVALQHSCLAQSVASDASDSAGYIEQSSCSLIWNEATRLTEDDYFGLRVNRMYSPTPFNALALTALASATIKTALQSLSRFFPIVSAQVKLEIRTVDTAVQVHLEPVGDVHAQHLEAVMGYLARLLRQLDPQAQGLVTGVHMARPDDQLHACSRLLGCEQVSSADGYYFSLPGAMLDMPLATADAFLLPRFADAMQDLLSHLPSNDLSEQVKRRIQLLLGSGDISVERVAVPLNISARHLRRKLSQEGTSYEQLVDEVRKEASIRLITEGKLSLTSIAYELGFLDPSSFTRAFRRWTDMSPTAFRRQALSQE